MRQFRHLTETQLRQIYVGYLTNEPKLAIARRLEIDHSTVHYHINKIKHLPESQVHALVAPKCARGHTSFKCLVCGRAHDNIVSEEFQEIRRLRAKVITLEQELARHQDQPKSSPVRTISG